MEYYPSGPDNTFRLERIGVSGLKTGAPEPGKAAWGLPEEAF
jgi:hypothetical protein